MSVNILMPALSPTMEKGNLARWLKKEGDKVKPGDVIAEIETDKATMEYEAIDEGTLAKIVVPEGTQDVPVNQLIAVLAEEGEDIKAVNVEKAASPVAQPTMSPRMAAASSPRRLPRRAQKKRSHLNRRDARPAPCRVLEIAEARGIGPGTAQSMVVATGYSLPRWRAASAKEAGLDLAGIAGSGPHGRIIARDVAAARSGSVGRSAPAPALSQVPAGMQPTADDKVRALFEPGSYELIAHDNMRKVIARRLVEAKQTIPHFYLTVDCGIGKLLAAREAINAAAPRDKDGKPAYKISVNDFVIKASRWRFSACPTPMSLGPKPPCSSIGIPISALRCRYPEALSRPWCGRLKRSRSRSFPTR